MAKRRKKKAAYLGCPHCDSMERPIIAQLSRISRRTGKMCPACRGVI